MSPGAGDLAAQARDELAGEGVGGVDDVAGQDDPAGGLYSEGEAGGRGPCRDVGDGRVGLDDELGGELLEELLPDGDDEAVRPDGARSLGDGSHDALVDAELLAECVSYSESM